MTRGDPLARAARTRSVLRSLAVVIALVSLWFAAWIVLPAPTYGLLTFSVGGPEVSPWLVVLSLAGAAAASVGVANSRLSRFDTVFRGPSSQLALYYMERFIASVVGAT